MQRPEAMRTVIAAAPANIYSHCQGGARACQDIAEAKKGQLVGHRSRKISTPSRSLVRGDCSSTGRNPTASSLSAAQAAAKPAPAMTIGSPFRTPPLPDDCAARCNFNHDLRPHQGTIIKPHPTDDVT